MRLAASALLLLKIALVGCRMVGMGVGSGALGGGLAGDRGGRFPGERGNDGGGVWVIWWRIVEALLDLGAGAAEARGAVAVGVEERLGVAGKEGGDDGVVGDGRHASGRERVADALRLTGDQAEHQGHVPEHQPLVLLRDDGDGRRLALRPELGWVGDEPDGIGLAGPVGRRAGALPVVWAPTGAGQMRMPARRATAPMIARLENAEAPRGSGYGPPGLARRV